jgi:hypothetical protein
MIWRHCRLVSICRRTFTTRTDSLTIDQVLRQLFVSYRQELERLQQQENEKTIERIQQLKAILKPMQIRETILADLDETQKLSHGND